MPRTKPTAPTGWRSRITGHGEEAPDQLLAHPSNWRQHPKAQQDALADVLDRVGWVQDVIVNRVTGHVVDGHLRVSLAISRQEPTVPVVYVDLDEEEERLILASLDPLAAMAVPDEEMLAELLGGVTSEGALAEMFAGLVELPMPDFEPVGIDEQGRLDQKNPVTCPECGHEFTT